MRNPTLRDRLVPVIEDQVNSEAALAQQLQEIAGRRYSVQQQLLTLQVELDELQRNYASLEGAIHQSRQECALQEAELCLQELGESARRLAAAFSVNNDKQTLVSKRNKLLGERPELAQEWEAFCAFETEQQTILSHLPEYHRNQILMSHAVLRERLQQLIDLNTQLTEVAATETVAVSCLLFHNLDTADLAIVLPIPEVALATTSGQAAPWHRAVDRFLDALFELGKRPEWEIIEMNTGSWAGCTTILTLAEYTGHQPIDVSFQFALNEYLSGITASAEPALLVEVAALSAAAWREGILHQPLEFEVETIALPGTEPGGEEEQLVVPSEEIVGVAGGWYTPDDLRSWTRQLRIAADSKWSQSARMARTMLSRMIGNGYIGTNSVAKEQLWHALPNDHADVLRQITSRLIDNGLLSVTHNSAETTVAVNPDLLDEAQNLINRMVSPFWEPILNIHA